MALLCQLGTSAINLPCGLNLVSPAAGFISFLRRKVIPCALHVCGYLSVCLPFPDPQ